MFHNTKAGKYQGGSRNHSPIFSYGQASWHALLRTSLATYECSEQLMNSYLYGGPIIRIDTQHLENAERRPDSPLPSSVSIRTCSRYRALKAGLTVTHLSDPMMRC